MYQFPQMVWKCTNGGYIRVYAKEHNGTDVASQRLIGLAQVNGR